MRLRNVRRTGVLALLASVSICCFSPIARGADTEDYRAGKNFIPTPVYSEEDDQKILAFFEGLRVADVADGMDKAGLQNIGLMSPEILILSLPTVFWVFPYFSFLSGPCSNSPFP